MPGFQNTIGRGADHMSCYLNVYVLLARILDEEGESFLPLWINGCVTSLKARMNRIQSTHHNLVVTVL